jgi:microcystin degradation protein MlrC
MRIGILAIQHESNTFIPEFTEIENFKEAVHLVGPSLLDFYRGGHHEVAGFIEGLEEAGYTPVPIFATFAFPRGPVSAAALEELWATASEELRGAGELDGLLVAPHGAAVSEHVHDMDGWWLSELRALVGPDMPIVGVIDLHANLSPKMASTCNALVAYRENPHVDQKERGKEAVSILRRFFENAAKPVMATAMVDIVLNIDLQSTLSEPLLTVIDRLDAVRSNPGILSVSMIMGYPYADVPEMGMAFMVVADGDVELAERECRLLAEWVLERRHVFSPDLLSIERALELALSSEKPVGLLDMGDNMGGGAPSDSTALLRYCTRAHPQLRFFACLWDPAAVAEAERIGKGGSAVLSMGGKSPMSPAPPLEALVKVRDIFDGRYSESKPRHGGWTEFYMGRTALVETENGSTIMLTALPAFPSSAQQMLAFGLDPKDFDIIILKGVHSPVTAYQEHCPTLLRVNTPGPTSADLASFTYQNRRRPLFPFEELPAESSS